MFKFVQVWAIKIMILVLANAINHETFSDTSSERNYKTWLYSSQKWLRNNLFNGILFACYIYLAAWPTKMTIPPTLVLGREYKHPLPDRRKLSKVWLTLMGNSFTGRFHSQGSSKHTSSVRANSEVLSLNSLT